MAATLAWGGHTNGRIPASAMTPVGRGFLLEITAALQFLAARAIILAARGIDILDYVNETYRDWDGQVYWRWWWSLRGKPNNAAIPGGSVHGWAKAIDFNEDALRRDGIYDYVMGVLEVFGFVRDVFGEGWHVSFREHLVQQWADTTPIPEQDWIDLMNADEFSTRLEAALAKALPNQNKNKEVVFGVNFASGDTSVDGLGQATKDNNPDPDWGNYFLIDWNDYTYTWLVTLGNIQDAQKIFGPARRVDSAFFIGKRNAFSRDAITKRAGV